MIIYNFKFNGNKFLKITIISIIIISIIIMFISINNLRKENKIILNDELRQNEVSTISSNQYTNILKQVYDDVDTYIGQKISFTGYVYKLYDFKNTEFILARDMLINESQTVVVGFLCTSEKAKDYKEGTWVNITGTIIKGYYHNPIPIIDITEIHETEKPENALVNPPDETYIATSTIL